MCPNPDSHKIVLEALIHGLNISMADFLSLLTYQAPISNLLLAPPIEPENFPASTTSTPPIPHVRPPTFPRSPWFPQRAFFTSLGTIVYILSVLATYTYIYAKSEHGQMMDEMESMSINFDEDPIIQTEYEESISDDDERNSLRDDEDPISDDDEEKPQRDDDDSIQGDDEDPIQDREENPPQNHERESIHSLAGHPSHDHGRDSIQDHGVNPSQNHEMESIQDHERWHRGRQRVRESNANQENEEEKDPILAWRANVS
ncbi:hypothetical protein CFE70_008747 [Pyrenophora teres f. teres 0-1]|uniref:Uncharacterized protein n=2 Tax=Pyrenophora teres f. teres TaxID=97479 RepID=E3S4M5_PYRTT|nr:hypothetical protein PTT_17538 [Pyrenophora teres f. teres 0-1]KAE8824871.1 hypothetical protein PTNB85_09635 [Pyrenophora teres f. teres]KAE8831688.1 hypothetical protein HRS9139_05930 [Pyrenophora teres f. teres]KAE8835573.1 hypothetical protein HRS9122_07843 [Pyrenophora teres f. teres]KAE8858473.1 hypothetical protein PTNB29_07688 [Pyrenophora teres f. teres]